MPVEVQMIRVLFRWMQSVQSAYTGGHSKKDHHCGMEPCSTVVDAVVAHGTQTRRFDCCRSIDSWTGLEEVRSI